MLGRKLAALGEPSRLSLLASAALDVVLDGKQKDRERVPQLLLALSEKDVLTPAHFSTAFLRLWPSCPTSRSTRRRRLNGWATS